MQLDVLRRAYFASAPSHRRWRIGIDAVIEQITAPSPRGSARSIAWKFPAIQWIDDVIIACACIGGEQQAWHHVQLANTWRLREVAELRLTPSKATLLVERFWRELQVDTRRTDLIAGMRTYRGGETLGRWLISRLLAHVESLPTGAMTRGNVDTILDTLPRLRTLGFEVPEPARVPQAT